MARMRPAGPGLRVYRFKIHQSHQPLNTLAIDLMAQSAKVTAHRPATPCRGSHVLFVYQPHQGKVLSRYGPWLVVYRRAMNA